MTSHGRRTPTPHSAFAKVLGSPNRASGTLPAASPRHRRSTRYPASAEARNDAQRPPLSGSSPTLTGLPRRRVLVLRHLGRGGGEAYAAKLRMAGVAVTTVRYDGVVHDFMLLNAMSEANATRAAIAFLREALGTT
ncbi:MAG: alpha/beta hydrolase fold domain-containing protein [Solirubrobacterales bacterium]|nr:alpha/beta hydrolase fold domain-containing protein [Solirubrobacterales bacterium]